MIKLINVYRKPLKYLGGSLLASLLGACTLVGIRNAEQPNYSQLLQEDEFEIRAYESRLYASTWVEGDYEEVQSKAFSRLADYIFGANQRSTEISMTAPVFQKAESKKSSANGSDQIAEKTAEKINMTSPVIQAQKKGGWEMSFLMPSRFKTIGDLPRPDNKEIYFRSEPKRVFAVISYSGYAGKEKNQKKAQRLKAWLKKKNEYMIEGEAFFAGYDPPWTLPFFRRNEMMIPVSVSK